MTIPKRLREDLGLVAGTVLDFSEENGRLVAKRVGGGAPIRKWRGRGHLAHGRSVDGYIRAVRGDG